MRILLFKAISNVKAHTRNGAAVRAHFRQAARYAAERHKGQTRSDGKTPYISHPIAVAKILHREGKVDDSVIMVAALLHDTIEDTGATHADIEKLFGRDVADVVMEVTNDDTLPKDQQKAAQIEHGATRSSRANTLKLADKIANLRDMVNAPWTSERKQAYYEHALKVVEAMPNAHQVLKDIFHREYAKR